MLTADQLRSPITSAWSTSTETIVWAAGEAGLRRAEISGPKWGDGDPEPRRLNVRRQIVQERLPEGGAATGSSRPRRRRARPGRTRSPPHSTPGSPTGMRNPWWATIPARRVPVSGRRCPSRIADDRCRSPTSRPSAVRDEIHTDGWRFVPAGKLTAARGNLASGRRHPGRLSAAGIRPKIEWPFDP